MKRIKAFTLLEMIIVVAIIWIISTSLLRMKNNSKNNHTDMWREAVNMIHKEIDQHLKNFQRNKVRENEWEINEIKYFRLIFSDTIPTETGTEIIIGNYYSGGTNTYFDSWTLINNQKYSAFQYLKWVDKYTFYTRNKSWVAINPIRISNNWKIYTWNNDAPNETELEENEYQFVICWWESWIIEHIGAITINAVTKESRLDRCQSEKYSGIDCNIFEKCK